MTRFRDVEVCINWLQERIDDHIIHTKVNYKIQKGRNLYLVLRLRGGTEHHTNDNVTTKTQNTFNTAHTNTDTRAHSSLVW